jgi:hypothetical protein
MAAALRLKLCLDDHLDGGVLEFRFVVNRYLVIRSCGLLYLNFLGGKSGVAPLAETTS